MFKIQVNLPFDTTGEVWLDTDRLEEPTDLQWDDSVEQYVQELLTTGYGYRGTIRPVTCPIDLEKAVRESGVKFEIVEGAEILEQEIQPVVEGRFY